jgi:hypothetical protein
MSETKALDLVTKRHSPFCNCAASQSAGTVCSCFTDEAAAELSELKKKEDWLSNLLAIIHRDGGHHEGNVGTKLAVEDAMKIYYELRAELDEAIRVMEPLTYGLSFM